MDMTKSFEIVVAATRTTWGIGKSGGLPWRLPGDMAFFKELTSTVEASPVSVAATSSASGSTLQNAVIMGRKTYESIPKKFRPLDNRLNVVLSRSETIREELALPEDVLVAKTFDEALNMLSIGPVSGNVSKVFVIGGGTVYNEAISSPFCAAVHLTEVDKDYEGMDTFFPAVPASAFRLVSKSRVINERETDYRFTKYERYPDSYFAEEAIPEQVFSKVTPPSANPEEMQYLDCIRDIIENGVYRGDRTGTGTVSKFGVQMRFSCRDGAFPLLTTKKVFWRGVAEELLWFVKGSTNAKELSDKNIHIWDGNGSREFLDSRGLSHREEGDLGPVYGFQWRHFGAEYGTMHDDYTGKGVDQLAECINKIKNNPNDRRIICSAWNPADLDKMALPPCHMFMQFYVADGEVSCQMYQRSADMGLGVPFNIASYSLLLVMVAQVCGLKPGEFVHTIGDAHVYSNHIDALKEQLQREPRAFPTIEINPEVKDIDGFNYSDFKIVGYQPDAAIKMKMAV